MPVSGAPPRGMREPTGRRRRERGHEPALGQPPHPVPEDAGREAAPRDDDARALRRIVERRAHDLVEHEVAERAVPVPALEALLGLERARGRAAGSSSSVASHSTRAKPWPVFPRRSASAKWATRSPRPRRARTREPQAVAVPRPRSSRWKRLVAETEDAPATLARDPRGACGRDSPRPRGRPLRGTGRRSRESEYAVDSARSMPSRRWRARQALPPSRGRQAGDRDGPCRRRPRPRRSRPIAAVEPELGDERVHDLLQRRGHDERALATLAVPSRRGRARRGRRAAGTPGRGPPRRSRASSPPAAPSGRPSRCRPSARPVPSPRRSARTRAVRAWPSTGRADESAHAGGTQARARASSSARSAFDRGRRKRRPARGDSTRGR